MRAVVPVRDWQGQIVSSGLVGVVYDPDMKRAGYRNLQLCNSVWACPVCAARITEARRQELTICVRLARAQGNGTALVTYTLQHSNGQSLKVTKDAVSAAYRTMKSGRWYQGMKAKYGILDSVRAFEVTHGDSGWHPHIHELMFFDHPLSSEELGSLRIEFRRQWVVMLEKQGFEASWARGVDIRTADDQIAGYVAKFGRDPAVVDTPSWSLEHEVAKAPVKTSSKGGRTPFQLLADYGDGDEAAGDLFVEYALTMKGSKQLVWSRGLRERLGLGAEVADGDIDDMPIKLPVVELTVGQWNSLLALPGRRNDIRHELLSVTEDLEGDPYLVAAWLIETARIYPIMPDGHILPIGELAGPVAADDRGPPDR